MIHDPAVKCLLFLQLAVIKIRSQMIKQQSNSWLAVTQSSLDASGRNVVFPSNIIDSQDSREITHSHKANIQTACQCVKSIFIRVCCYRRQDSRKTCLCFNQQRSMKTERVKSRHILQLETNQVKLKQIKQMVGYQQHVLLFERKQQEKT